MSLQGILVVTHDNYLVWMTPNRQEIVESFGKFNSADEAVDYAKGYRDLWLEYRQHLTNEDIPIEISGNVPFVDLVDELSNANRVIVKESKGMLVVTHDNNLAILPKESAEDIFLSELVRHVKIYGWEGRGDYEEVWKFVEWCHKRANKPVNEDIDPYEDEDDPLELK